MGLLGSSRYITSRTVYICLINRVTDVRMIALFSAGDSERGDIISILFVLINSLIYLTLAHTNTLVCNYVCTVKQMLFKVL